MTEIIDIVEPYITGPQGVGGTIESATAVGLAAGADPTVTLGGTPEQRTIEFGIPEGEQGTPAAIIGASASTLEPGEDVTVTVGGTPDARTFAFGIPKGEPGDGSINSVNGDLGPDVVLDAEDVGAVPTDQYASTTQRGIVELATNQEAVGGSDSSRAVTPAALKAALQASAVGSVDLVSKLRYPVFIGHRGARLVYPEHSMLGYRKSFESGFSPEADVRALADGTLVCVHDATTARTMTGASASVSSMSREDWESRLIKPITRPGIIAGLQERPVYFEDYLDEFGGRCVLWPEIKDSAAAQDVFDAVLSRGLAGSVVIQSFDFAVAQAAVAEGLHALALNPTQTPQQVVDAGIEFVGLPMSATQTQVNNFTNAGLHVIIYTANTVAEATQRLGWGVSGIFSDDPWLVSQRGSAGGALRPESGGWPMGDHKVDEALGSGGRIEVLGNSLRFRLDSVISGSPPSSVSIANISSIVNGGSTVYVRFTAFSTTTKLTTNFSWIAGIYLGEASDRGAFIEKNNERFRLMFLRRDGRMHAYERRTYTGATTEMGSSTTPSGWPSYPIDKPTETYEIMAVFAPTAMSMTLFGRDGDNRSVSASHSSWAGMENLYAGIAVRGGESFITNVDVSVLP